MIFGTDVAVTIAGQMILFCQTMINFNHDAEHTAMTSKENWED